MTREQRWFELNPNWIRLEKHIASCDVEECSCRVLYNNFEKWSMQLQHQEHTMEKPGSEKTWLWFTFNKHGYLRWQCLFCNEPIDESPQPQTIKIQNLLKHHSSNKHTERVQTLFPNDIIVNADGAPSKEIFKELLEAFQKDATMYETHRLPSGVIVGIE